MSVYETSLVIEIMSEFSDGVAYCCCISVEVWVLTDTQIQIWPWYSPCILSIWYNRYPLKYHIQIQINIISKYP